MKSQIALCLLFIIIAAGLLSCGAAQTPADVESVTDEHSTTKAESTAYIDTLPIIEMSGYKFRVIGQSTLERQNFYTEEKDGDVINDSILLRDQVIEERLGVELECLSLADRIEVANKVINTVLADDPAYEMAITAMSAGINKMISAGVMFDLNEIDYLSLDSRLWDASIHRNMQFLGKQFFSTGVISAQFSQSPVACVFNKRLVSDYNLADIYDIVLSGDWTIDFMSSCMKDAANDLDGNNIMDINDFYGFALDGVFGNVLYAAADYNPITVEGNKYSVNLSSERIIDVIDKCAGIFGNPNVTYHNTKSDGSSLLVFREGRSIFTTCDMLDVQKFRDMDDDFGIIPTPKYEESQDKYITSCTTWLPTGVAVPINCRNIEKVGLVMETMAAVSADIIVPAVYEVTLQGKVSRDDVSSIMLDIIFENPSYDFITVFDFGGSGTKLRKAVLGWEENWVSTWAGIKDTVEAEINGIIENIE